MADTDKDRRDRFYAFVRKANEAGVTVQPQRGARQFMIQFPEGNLFLAAEAAAVGAFIRFAADPDVCFRADFLSALLNLRTDLVDLAGEGRVTWQDLFATSFTVALGEWLVGQGLDLRAIHQEIKSKKDEVEREAHAATFQSIQEKTREMKIAEAREALEDALISYKYAEMSLRAQCKHGEQMQEDVRKAVGLAFSEDQLLRFYELYAVVLAREKRRIANTPQDELEAEAHSYGSDMPPSEFEIAQKEALATFEQEQAEATDRFEEVYAGLYDQEDDSS
ncbi:hypothetical protein IT087_02710 [Candidatus Uhrbacteria bacterium]|nr:hypothetical protein [Candidatus Uhrbacteria bacterium]